MTREITVRVAAPSEAGAIAELLAEAFAEQREFFTEETFALSTPAATLIAERIGTHLVWVAAHPRGVVGTISAEPRTSSLWVRSLAVKPSARGARVAHRLLSAVEQHAIEDGFNCLELDTTPFQVAAARVYRQFGFREQLRHEFRGMPMIRMIKRLERSAGSPAKPL
jgi:GNAT superfamily N-acetyltransferase